MRAYVFIDVEGDPTEVVSSLRDIPGVKEADTLFGPTDGVAHIEAPDETALMEVIGEMYEIEGLSSTDTRIVIE
ncbi:MAG: Lrp/AsnC ligand binding domain-containing protein [Anaerolineae bacterium]